MSYKKDRRPSTGTATPESVPSLSHIPNHETLRPSLMSTGASSFGGLGRHRNAETSTETGKLESDFMDS